MKCRKCGIDFPDNYESVRCPACLKNHWTNMQRGCLYIVLGVLAIIGLIVYFWKSSENSGEFLVSVFWLFILTFVLLVILGFVNAARKSPEELQESIYGLHNWEILCPHCQVKGRVRTMIAEEDTGISGKKATAAALTGGISILATGLSRNEKVTQAHCDNCGSTWTY